MEIQKIKILEISKNLKEIFEIYRKMSDSAVFFKVFLY